MATDQLSEPRTRFEPLVALRFAFGAALIAAPGRVLDACGTVDDPRARVVTRILGLRHIAEGCVLVAWDTPRVALGGAAVDGIHAATALALAAGDPRRRRAALTNAAVATGFTALGVVRARRGR
jgi:hypothetical protein